MESTECGTDTKQTLTKWLTKQPFLYVLLLALLAATLWLAKEGQDRYLPYVLGIGAVSIVVVSLGSICHWLVGWGDRLLIHLSYVEQKFSLLTHELAHQSESFTLMAQTQQLGLRDKSLLLLVEDSKIDIALIRGVLNCLVLKFGITMGDVPSLAAARMRAPQALALVLDVNLLESGVVEAKEFVRQVGAIVPIVVYCGDQYSPADFPQAHGVIQKMDFEKLTEALEQIILTRR